MENKYVHWISKSLLLKWLRTKPQVLK